MDIKSMHREGRPIKVIARLTGLSRNTVRRVVRSGGRRLGGGGAADLRQIMAVGRRLRRLTPAARRDIVSGGAWWRGGDPPPPATGVQHAAPTYPTAIELDGRLAGWAGVRGGSQIATRGIADYVPGHAAPPSNAPRLFRDLVILAGAGMSPAFYTWAAGCLSSAQEPVGRGLIISTRGGRAVCTVGKVGAKGREVPLWEQWIGQPSANKAARPPNPSEAGAAPAWGFGAPKPARAQAGRAARPAPGNAGRAAVPRWGPRQAIDRAGMQIAARAWWGRVDGLQFPALARGDDSPATLTVQIGVADARAEDPGAAILQPETAPPWRRGDFRLRIEGIEAASQASSVGAISCRRATSILRTGRIWLAPPVFAPFEVTIPSRESETAFGAWARMPEPRGGRLEFLSPSGLPYLTVKFLGLAPASPPTRRPAGVTSNLAFSGAALVSG